MSMTMIHCAGCGRELSTTTESCPFCGLDIEHTLSLADDSEKLTPGFLAAGILLLVVLTGLVFWEVAGYRERERQQLTNPATGTHAERVRDRDDDD